MAVLRCWLLLWLLSLQRCVPWCVAPLLPPPLPPAHCLTSCVAAAPHRPPQALAVTTLGCSRSAQRVDSMSAEMGEGQRFYLQYFFPPSSVGEVGRVGGPGRREVGHGNLAGALSAGAWGLWELVSGQGGVAGGGGGGG